LNFTPAQFRLFLKAMINRIISFRVEGIHHIPREGGALLVCNHADIVDGLLVALFSGRHVAFPGRQDARDSKVFATIDRTFRDLREQMGDAGPAFDLGDDVLDLVSQLLLDIGRTYPFTGGWLPPSRPLEEHHEYLRELLESGHMVAVFPGTSLTRGRKAGTFDPAIARLLLETRVPVVPAGLYGTHGLSDMGRWVAGRNRSRVVIYRIGLAIDPAQLPEEASKANVRLWTGKLEEKVERLLKTAGRGRMSRKSAQTTSPTSATPEAQTAPGATVSPKVGFQAELPFGPVDGVQ
jgi:1-acyl-sn-glycerol-3-phosphate acyltransferase